MHGAVTAFERWVSSKRETTPKHLSVNRGGSDVPADTRTQRSTRSLNLTTGGITLLGVLVSMGTTVGLGIDATLPIRLLAGIGTTLVLVVVVKVGTGAGHGPVARLANWIIGSPPNEE